MRQQPMETDTAQLIANCRRLLDNWKSIEAQILANVKHDRAEGFEASAQIQEHVAAIVDDCIKGLKSVLPQ